MDFILYSYNCILVFLSFWWQARSAAISTREIFRGWQVEHLPQIAGQSAVEASSLQDLKIYSHSHTYFVEREVFKLIFTNLRFHKVFITRSKDIYSLHHTHFTLQTQFITFLEVLFTLSHIHICLHKLHFTHLHKVFIIRSEDIHTPFKPYKPAYHLRMTRGPSCMILAGSLFSCFIFRFHCY